MHASTFGSKAFSYYILSLITDRLSIYSVVGRKFGFGCSIREIISLNSCEYRDEMGGYCAVTTFLYKPAMSFALKGGRRAAIS